MTRIAQDKPYRTLIGGFITEATPLTFPENSAQDIDNCDIELKGDVRRRLGLNEEANGFTIGQGLLADRVNLPEDGGPFSITPAGPQTCPQANLAITAWTWPHPGSVPNLNFIVFQIGNTMIVRNWDAQPVSSPAGILDVLGISFTEFQIDDPTTGVIFNTTASLGQSIPLQAAPGFGHLFFTGPHVIPFYLALDPKTLQLSMSPVGYDPTNTSYANGRMDIRDFNGVNDGILNSVQPPSLSDLHRYNLWNQGWGDNLINTYQSGVPGNTYPSNSQQWILGIDASTGNFSATVLAQQDFGTGEAPKGRGIIHALFGNKDASFAGQEYSSGNNGTGTTAYGALSFNGTQDERATTGFTTTAFYAGRIWFSGAVNPSRPNGIYFSATLQDITDCGIYMQVGDPTAQNFNALLATDGGVIYLTEAGTILKLMAYGSGILVFADNGVWFIYGGTGTGGFTATNYSVEKVSATGLLSPTSLAQSDTSTFYFATNSIQAVTLPETGIVPVVSDVAQTKVFTYYASIPQVARANANGCFDPISKKVFWSWLSAPTYSYPTFQSCYNNMLILDTRTGAFSKYSFTDSLTGPYFMNGPAFPKRTITTPEVLDYVVTATGGGVVTASGGQVEVFVEASETTEFLNSVKVCCIDGSAQALRVMEFYDTSFFDYNTMGSYVPQDYDSFVQTGQETLQDVQRNKQATWVHAFFNRTETEWITDVSGNLVMNNQSGCTMVCQWDWNNTAAGGRWSAPQSIYRYRRPVLPQESGDPIDTGDAVVYTKSKARGRGRALSILFSSVTGKDFQLLGWSVPYTAAQV